LAQGGAFLNPLIEPGVAGRCLHSFFSDEKSVGWRRLKKDLSLFYINSGVKQNRLSLRRAYGLFPGLEAAFEIAAFSDHSG
jgi:hypothetical protein